MGFNIIGGMGPIWTEFRWELPGFGKFQWTSTYTKVMSHYYDQGPAGPEHPADRERELLIASIDELTADDRRHVAALVDSLRKKAAMERPGR